MYLIKWKHLGRLVHIFDSIDADFRKLCHERDTVCCSLCNFCESERCFTQDFSISIEYNIVRFYRSYGFNSLNDIEWQQQQQQTTTNAKHIDFVEEERKRRKKNEDERNLWCANVCFSSLHIQGMFVVIHLVCCLLFFMPCFWKLYQWNSVSLNL